MANPTSTDVAIIGAGIIGLAIAREIALRDPSARVTVFDKEATLGAHASGRNSGVLHAGFYYAPDSLKARLTRDGNRMMHALLDDHGVRVRRTGKVVVATDDTQLAALDELARRGAVNGVDVQVVGEQQLRELEPQARTVSRALWSPTTSVASPAEVIAAVCADAQRLGVQVRLGDAVHAAGPGWVHAASGRRSAGHIVNAAGLHADRVAAWFDAAGDYVMLPFTGLYWYATVPEGWLTRHVYPVPDPRNPFLGAHATVTVDGRVKVGPTAIPALWRESYGGLSGFSARDVVGIAAGLAGLARSRHHDLGALVRSEVPKHLRRHLVGQVRALVPDLDPTAVSVRGASGIRAQLFDTAARRLEMDFVVRAAAGSTHMLNSVSPAWTSSLAVAAHTVDGMVARGVLAG